MMTNTYKQKKKKEWVYKKNSGTSCVSSLPKQRPGYVSYSTQQPQNEMTCVQAEQDGRLQCCE